MEVHEYKVRLDAADEWESHEAPNPGKAAIAFVSLRQSEDGLDEDEEQISDDVMVETPEGELLHFRVDTHVEISRFAVPIVMEPEVPEELDGEEDGL